MGKKYKLKSKTKSVYAKLLVKSFGILLVIVYVSGHNKACNLLPFTLACPDEWRDHPEARRICGKNIGDNCTIKASSTYAFNEYISIQYYTILSIE